MAGINKTRTQLTLLYTKIMEFLKKCNITIILFYGSLLGYYREKTFIEGDDDIDVIISENDHSILLKYLHVNKDSNINVGLNNQYIIQLYCDNIGPFDIYIFNNYNDNILLRHDGNLLFNKCDIFPYKPVCFNNFDVFIPNNTEKIIVDLYGSTWKTPQVKGVDYDWGKINNVKKIQEYSYQTRETSASVFVSFQTKKNTNRSRFKFTSMKIVI